MIWLPEVKICAIKPSMGRSDFQSCNLNCAGWDVLPELDAIRCRTSRTLTIMGAWSDSLPRSFVALHCQGMVMSYLIRKNLTATPELYSNSGLWVFCSPWRSCTWLSTFMTNVFLNDMKVFLESFKSLYLLVISNYYKVFLHAGNSYSWSRYKTDIGIIGVYISWTYKDCWQQRHNFWQKFWTS